MDKDVFLLVVCHTLYICSVVFAAHHESKLVWLKDVTDSLLTNKRKFSDANLPDNLAFQLIDGSRSLTLNLKRNYAIDPNADVYFVSKVNDGRLFLEKAETLKEENLAYYQDKQNGAFMTVKCLRRSNGGCDRVIHGNVLIEDRNYDLQPAKTDVTSRDLYDVPDLGTGYVLRDQIHVHNENPVTYEDTANDKAKNIDKVQPQRFANGQEQVPYPNVTFVARQKSSLQTKGNGKHVYHVETAVVLDSTIWNFYYSLMVLSSYAQTESCKVARKIREVYSHIINGVNLRYSTIEDPGIEISVFLHEFYIFKTMKDLGHDVSMVEIIDGIHKVEVSRYINHEVQWTNTYAKSSDHVMLFTKYAIYDKRNGLDALGFAFNGMVCDPFLKTSLIQSRDYFITVTTAAHELAHNLGANHDGEGNAKACRADDYFLMTSLDPRLRPSRKYSRNPWIFSNCSVDVFKHALQNKTCLKNLGTTYDQKEWNTFTHILPGQVYSVDHQCALFNGHGSAFCGNKSPEICLSMKCTDPFTTKCLPTKFSAYRGTDCGINMWCKEGLCVSKTAR